MMIVPIDRGHSPLIGKLDQFLSEIINRCAGLTSDREMIFDP